MKLKVRPTHSAAGFVRRMQMSTHRYWILVEGIFDRSFYAQLCTDNPALTNEDYTIAVPRELQGFSADGKGTLLYLYRYLHRRKLLACTLGGKKTIVLFILDKDIDDLERTQARSPHVLYTQYYSVENYAFRFGDLSSALASAACLDLAAVRQRIGVDAFAWTRCAADNWRLWVEYCLLARKLRIQNVRNYRLENSLMHSGPYTPCDEAKRKALLNKAMRNSGLTESEFERASRSVKKFVDTIYSEGNHDRVFKGQWYGKFLVVDAEKAAGSRRYSRKGLEERLRACLLVTLDFSASWTDHFNNAIGQLINIH